MDYRKILVAVDQYKHSMKVFEEAVELAKKENAQLFLLHVVEQKTPDELMDRIGTYTDIEQTDSIRLLRQYNDQEVSQARAWLGELSEMARDRSVDVMETVEIGDPAELICDIAKRWKADLIVLGRTRRGELLDRFIGSVTNYVVHHTPCSVLLVY